MATIALLTDFGLQDNFVGVIKAVLLKLNPGLKLIDLTHSVAPQDVVAAAFLLNSSYRYFSRRTIFLVVVDPGVGSTRRPIIVRSKNYFFVGPDNGCLSLAAGEDGIKEIVAIENKKYCLRPISNTFQARDIFAPAAAHLAKKTGLGLFGRRLAVMKRLSLPKPRVVKNGIKGKIIYIDGFGNLVTNIDKGCLDKLSNKFAIKLKDARITALADSYQAAGAGRPLAIFDSFDLLEIAVNQGNAQKLFGVRIGASVLLENPNRPYLPKKDI